MNYRDDIDNDVISRKYLEGYSASDLSREFDTTVKTIIERLKKCGIDTRGKNNYITDRISKKIKEKQTGTNNSNYKGTKVISVCECCGKKFTAYDNGVRKFRFCSNECAHKEMDNPMKGKFGREHSCWKEEKKGTFKHFLRNSHLYNEWRTKVFEQDNYTCQNCGQYGGYLEAHHHKKFAEILSENNIKTYNDSIQCDELWNIDNGITYCLRCHAEKDASRHIKR